jgi:hypothetical protein
MILLLIRHLTCISQIHITEVFVGRIKFFMLGVHCTRLHPAHVEVLMLNPPILLYAQKLKTANTEKKNTPVIKDGYRWKTTCLKCVVSKVGDGGFLLYETQYTRFGNRSKDLGRQHDLANVGFVLLQC